MGRSIFGAAIASIDGTSLRRVDAGARRLRSAPMPRNQLAAGAAMVFGCERSVIAQWCDRQGLWLERSSRPASHRCASSRGFDASGATGSDPERPGAIPARPAGIRSDPARSVAIRSDPAATRGRGPRGPRRAPRRVPGLRRAPAHRRRPARGRGRRRGRRLSGAPPGAPGRSDPGAIPAIRRRRRPMQYHTHL